MESLHLRRLGGMGLWREIAARAEGVRERIAELTALLDGFDTTAEEIRITRKALLELPDPSLPVPRAAKLPGHPAYQQITAVFAAADAPLWARAVCEAMDWEVAPSDINNVRLKLERLAERGGPGRYRAGAVHPATAVAPPAGRNQSAQPNRKAKPGITSGAALWGHSVAPMSGHVCRPAEKTRCE
ncbi:hypothetical protein [Streptomyces sp. NPDC093149]|uniref:hypothetical protein n=1 Tax=Streptomyces sp. NPDC093149 TaxID=3366031 RepID=UPI00381B8EF4